VRCLWIGIRDSGRCFVTVRVLTPRHPRRCPASAVGAVNKALTDFAYDEGMISVSDSQLRIVATAADLLPGEARGKFLRRIVAELREDQDFKDVDVEQAVHAALLDLSESPSD
jgi:hypothetical protein